MTVVAKNAAIGAALGAFLGLTAIVGSPAVFQLITASSLPRLWVLAFVGAFSLTLAAGYSATGFILAAIDRRLDPSAR